MRARFAKTPAEAAEAQINMHRRQGENALTIAEGADEFNPRIPPSQEGKRGLDVTLHGDKLSLTLDGVQVLENLPVPVTDRGNVILGAKYSEEYFGGWEYPDDIYSAVFADLVVTSMDDSAKQVILDNRLSGWELVAATASGAWNTLVNWFVRTF